MNFANLASIIVILGMALLPTVIAAYVSGSRERDSEPEHGYDYR